MANLVVVAPRRTTAGTGAAAMCTPPATGRCTSWRSHRARTTQSKGATGLATDARHGVRIGLVAWLVS